MGNDIVSQIFQHWWLIFLLPAFGGIVRATIFGGRRRERHRQRDQQWQTPAPRPMGYEGQSQPAHDSPTLSEQAAKLMAEHENAEASWLEYELDVKKLIDYPMMSDVREPLTADFLRAKRIADALKPQSAKQVTSREQLTEYRDAVRNFEVSFDLAEREAHRVKDGNFKPEERARLATARKLLKMATDEASTQYERQLAYQRAKAELDGLLRVPDEAVAALEAKVSDPSPSDSPLPGDRLRAEDEARLRENLAKTLRDSPGGEHKLPQQRS